MLVKYFYEAQCTVVGGGLLCCFCVLITALSESWELLPFEKYLARNNEDSWHSWDSLSDWHSLATRHTKIVLSQLLNIEYCLKYKCTLPLLYIPFVSILSICKAFKNFGSGLWLNHVQWWSPNWYIDQTSLFPLRTHNHASADWWIFFWVRTDMVGGLWRRVLRLVPPFVMNLWLQAAAAATQLC